MVGVTGFEPAGKAALRAIFLVARFKKSAAPITRGHGFIAAYIIKKACTSYEVQALVGVTGFEFVLCIKISCIRSLLMFMAAYFDIAFICI